MTHQGLPVAGYKPQGHAQVELVNENKRLEERVIRQIEMMGGRATFDQRMVALARTKIQEGFMWLNRAVFQPGRVNLPEDEAGAERSFIY